VGDRTEEGQDGAFSQGEIPHFSKGGDGELVRGETRELTSLEEEVSEVTVFRVEGSDRRSGRREVLHWGECMGRTRLGHGGGAQGREA